MKKTLGGDRLGAGKKMQVELHGYQRSTHDLGYLWRSTMSAGTLVPYMSELALPGDTFDIDLDVDVKTHPTVGPLFGSFKIQLDTFLAPIRLYNSALHNNKLGIGLNMSQIKLPQIELDAFQTIQIDLVKDLDNSQINPSCLLSYLGIRGVGNNQEASPKQRDFNAVPILAYWEIYKNYYSNKQEKIGAVIHRGNIVINTTVDSIEITDANNNTSAQIPQQGAGINTAATGQDWKVVVNYTGTKPEPNTITFYITNFGWLKLSDISSFIADFTGYYEAVIDNNWHPLSIQFWDYIAAPNSSGLPEVPKVATFGLENIDEMREMILSWGPTSQFKINELGLAPYSYLHTSNADIPFRMSTQEGLAIKTYQSDKFNNWLDAEYMDAISDASAISIVGGQFTVDQLLLATKVYEMLNRIAVSGGTYDDWLDVTYAHDRVRRSESPMYMGGLIRELVFQEVISNSASEGQVLGTLAGKGIMAGKKKGGRVRIKVDEPSYIIGIVSITPRIDYSQGNKWDVHLKTMDDFHKPALDQIGFQDDITEERAWWDTSWDETNQVWVQKSAGKQPAWLNYMTNVNKTFGNFAITDNEMFMTLNRRYEYDDVTNPTIKDLTTYIDPTKYNFIFAETAIDAQNFWTQISVDITARRKMSAKVMPNL